MKGFIGVVAALVLMLVSGTASAWRVDMLSAQDGATLNRGDQVVIDVFMDSEGASDVTVLAVGVVFNDISFIYRQDLSSTHSYLLYTSGKTPYLIATTSCGGFGGPTAGDGCRLFGEGTSGFIPNQVNVEFISSQLPLGVPTPTAGFEQTVTLVFEAVNPGIATFDFIFDIDRGNILQLGDGTRPPLDLGSSVVVTVVPEPATVLLVGLGLVGIALTRRR